MREFAKAHPIVHLEQKRPGVFLDEPEDVQPNAEMAKIPQEEALNSDESADFLAAIAAEYEGCPTSTCTILVQL